MLRRLGFGVLLGLGVVAVPALTPGGSLRRGAFEFEKDVWAEWFVLGFACFFAVFSLAQLVRLRRHASEVGRPPEPRDLMRTSMPKAIYERLLAVAAADGRIDPVGRAVVEDLMLHCLPTS